MTVDLTTLLDSMRRLTAAYHAALEDPTTGADGIDATVARLLLATHAGPCEVSS